MNQDTRPLIRVVAGIVLDSEGRFLLSSRPQGKPYAGYWEFAGGKVEQGESNFEALRREFDEELGIRILAAKPWLTKIHSYEHARVCLNFLWVEAHEWTGSLQAKEGQQWKWQQAGDFTVAPMLPANGALLKALSVPRVFEGNLKEGLLASNAAGIYRVVPQGAENAAAAQGIWLAADMLVDFVQTSEQSLWAVVENPQQWQLAQAAADVAVWRVGSAASARLVLEILAQGVCLPLVVAAKQELLPAYRALWENAGAHAVVCDGGEAV